MPALVAPSPLEVAVPARDRRRVWAHPDVVSHSLVVLTYDRLYLTPLAGTPKRATLAAAEGGTDLNLVVGPLATVVDLATVRRVKLDLLANTLVVEHHVTGTECTRLTVTFATTEAADACFTKVWRRLGGGVELVPYRKDTWAAARGPLAALFAVLALTAVLATLTAVTGAGGWRTVCGVGGAAAGLVQVWLYRRLTRPPVCLEVVRR